jgi:hypothetical protein
MSNFPGSKYSKESLGYGIPNMLAFTLASNVTTSGTTFTVTENAETKGLPNPASGYKIYGRIGALDVDDEVVLITARSSTSITVIRNIDSRGASTHTAGDILYICFAAEHLNTITDLLDAIQSEIIATGTAGEDIEPYRVLGYNSSGELVKAKADTLENSLVVGMNTVGFIKGATAYCLRSGVITNDDWYYTAQKRLWLSSTTAGVLLESRPETGYEVCCAITKTATTIDFRAPYWGMINAI